MLSKRYVPIFKRFFSDSFKTPLLLQLHVDGKQIFVYRSDKKHFCVYIPREDGLFIWMTRKSSEYVRFVFSLLPVFVTSFRLLVEFDDERWEKLISHGYQCRFIEVRQ